MEWQKKKTAQREEQGKAKFLVTDTGDHGMQAAIIMMTCPVPLVVCLLACLHPEEETKSEAVTIIILNLVTFPTMTSLLCSGKSNDRGPEAEHKGISIVLGLISCFTIAVVGVLVVIFGGGPKKKPYNRSGKWSAWR